MRTITYPILLLLFFVSSLAIANNETDTIQPPPKNEAIEHAIQLRKDGKIEESIRVGLQIFASKIEFSLKDSLRISRTLAHNLRSIGDYEHALEYARKSIDLDQNLHSKEKPDFLFLVGFFNSYGQYDSTIYYLKIKAQDQLSKTNKNDYGLAKNNNNIGYTYYLAGELDSAELYYKKVTATQVSHKNHMDIIGLATGNLGQLYFEKEDYKNALVNMKIDAELTKGRINESYHNATLGIAACHLMLEEYNAAKKSLLIFFDLPISNHKLLKRGYRLMAEVQQKLNNNYSSAIYLRKYVHLTDSLTQIEKPNKELINQLSRNRINIIKSDLKLSESMVKLMNNELLLAKTKEKTEEFKNRVYIILLVLSIFSAILIVLYFRNRQRKNKEIQTLENELLESEIQYRKKDLNNLATNLSYKRKFIDEIQGELKELYQKPDDQLKESVSALIREFTNYKNADKSVEVLQADIDKVNLSFFNKLGEKFPLLTENEKELCGLFLLKLSSKDIAIIRNVTPNAIKKARQRIRKKLPISESEKINTLLELL